ncbi:hypothetical protein [Micromonospora sp. DT31]|uniref:hypothetical protein n=1 Tax=Micromonospora sp. DT31 TaxID=3393434 RepID=UPI003CEB1B87
MGVTVVRHLAGMAAAWLLFVAEVVVGYLVLLAYALVTGADPGGPLAGPLLVLAAAVCGVVAVPLLFAPAVAVGEVVGRRRGTAAAGVALAGVVAVVLAAGYTALGVTAVGAPGEWFPLVVSGGALLALPPTIVYALTAGGIGWFAGRVARRRAVGAPAR